RDVDPRRTGHRHRGIRRLSSEIPDLHAAKAPLDPRRLAAAGMVEVDGSWSGRTDAEPAVGDLALEDLRQSAAKCGRDFPTGTVSGRLGVAPRRDHPVVWSRAGDDRISVAVLARHLAVEAAAGSIVARLL